MNINNQKLNITIPICIYTNNNNSVFTIPNYNKTLQQYECNYTKYSKWKLDQIIYVLSSSIYPPQPYGTTMYKIINNINDPYETLSIEIIENSMNVSSSNQSDNEFTFFAYTYHVPNTIPLYIYRTEDNLRSKSDGPAVSHDMSDSLLITTQINNNLLSHPLSPLYVMKEPYTSFKCHFSICIPNGFDYSNFSECVNKCNIIEPTTLFYGQLTPSIKYSPSSETSQTLTLFNNLSENDYDKYNQILFVSIFILFIILLIFMFNVHK